MEGGDALSSPGHITAKLIEVSAKSETGSSKKRYTPFGMVDIVIGVKVYDAQDTPLCSDGNGVMAAHSHTQPLALMPGILVETLANEHPPLSSGLSA
jgi:hypothetical protein